MIQGTIEKKEVETSGRESSVELIQCQYKMLGAWTKQWNKREIICVENNTMAWLYYKSLVVKWLHMEEDRKIK